MKLELLKTQTSATGSIVNSYTIGNYAITEHIRNNISNIYTTPNMDANDFLPNIYSDQRWEDGRITNFVIQTTSYGSLSVEDTEKFIEAYQEAVEVTETLKDKFVIKDI
nr:MAG TPA: hypothetical protein [Bacteriophage sp.]